MESVERAIWFIENNYRNDISLAVVAEAISVSKFHLVRAFGLCTGYSVDGYIRARRLSEAAKHLAGGPAGILNIALSVGYGSHEAFTRAFRQRFGTTPDQVRKSQSLDILELVEPIRMEKEQFTNIPEPRIVSGAPLLIVGLKRRYNDQGSGKIPSQWQDFAPHVGHVLNQKGEVTFGVLYNSDDEGNIDYLTGTEVTEIIDVPPELDSIRIPSQTYAVFEHSGHISNIRRTWASIFGKWLPKSGMRLVDAPQFERYAESFDARTGNARVEIWKPVH